MFALHDRPAKLCDGISHRELLRLGGLSVLGLSLPIPMQPRLPAEAPPPPSAPSIMALPVR
jgi:hypothetical protein